MLAKAFSKQIPKQIPPLLAFVLGAALLAGCGGPPTVHAAIEHVVAIPKGQGVFAPFILPVPANARVTWRNADAVPHTISTTPDHTAYLNPVAFSLTIPAGGSASFILPKPGIYDYYDPAAASWSTTDHRVAANAGMPDYPLAMEGVLWAQGPVGGLAASVTNPIPGKDQFTSEFVAIPQGGSVYWYNADSDTHVVTTIPGWSGQINPADVGIGAVKGATAAPPNGETRAVTFATPGLYYYYCSAHADVDARWHRAKAHASASDYPIAMEGFVLVLPR